MKPFYKTLGHAEDEIIIKKSRFRSFIYNIRSEAEAQTLLARLRQEFSDATHVCYAYVLGLCGNVERFSDDGEPSGTAGMPILDVIKNSGYSEVLAVVVRYFGGIKLGAGGLVRAYSESIKGCISKAKPIEFCLSNVFKLSLDFAQGKKINQLLANIACKTLEISYNESGMVLTVAAPQDTDFARLATDFLAGKLKLETLEPMYIQYD